MSKWLSDERKSLSRNWFDIALRIEKFDVYIDLLSDRIIFIDLSRSKGPQFQFFRFFSVHQWPCMPSTYNTSEAEFFSGTQTMSFSSILTLDFQNNWSRFLVSVELWNSDQSTLNWKIYFYHPNSTLYLQHWQLVPRQ